MLPQRHNNGSSILTSGGKESEESAFSHDTLILALVSLRPWKAVCSLEQIGESRIV
jgi:hypothetical protein